MKFENWMIGQEVQEISTGDRGIITRKADYQSQGAYIRWTSGQFSGQELWLEMGKFTFISDENGSVAGKLAQIEKLVAEIRVLLEGK